jgi:hypothetical protein
VDSDTSMDGADVTLPIHADCTTLVTPPAPATSVPARIEEVDDAENVIDVS